MPSMIRKTHLALAANLVICVGTGVLAQSEPARPPAGPSAIAVIKDTAGTALGTLRIERYDMTKSRVTVNIRGLAPGFHGLHIHTAGVCDPSSVDAATGSPFSSAGGHLDPSAGSYGMAAGNLPSLLVAGDGTANASFVTDRFAIPQLADTDGSAVVVHAKADNFANIPTRYTHPSDATGTMGPDSATLKSGDAGDRVGCGVIRVLT
ncbi:hypothetical protein GCM10023194_00750 [Planotetraspora phitsanulokensis]|uniref:Superoxide dismutase [Cu-Zn] n=1 Tax=Planotetraspora phitsanulokensis TaxID=575192 RepID=A0A8J3UAK3_9ACTN|nr:superoxide dismutase family protein [Planotetraspora phitsanulokensis]GII40107.1 hypothetical protein Pph01_51100 [Planotetraspora phitsanulokensis]